MKSYQYMDSHYKDEIVLQPSYLYNGNPYPWKDGLGPILTLKSMQICFYTENIPHSISLPMLCTYQEDFYGTQNVQVDCKRVGQVKAYTYSPSTLWAQVTWYHEVGTTSCREIRSWINST